MAAITKNNRIHLRVSDDDKELLELAAKYNKQTLSAYIFEIAIRQAELDVRKNEVLTLNNEERDILLKALDQPLAPNDALRNLFK